MKNLLEKLLLMSANYPSYKRWMSTKSYKSHNRSKYKPHYGLNAAKRNREKSKPLTTGIIVEKMARSR